MGSNTGLSASFIFAIRSLQCTQFLSVSFILLPSLPLAFCNAPPLSLAPDDGPTIANCMHVEPCQARIQLPTPPLAAPGMSVCSAPPCSRSPKLVVRRSRSYPASRGTFTRAGFEEASTHTLCASRCGCSRSVCPLSHSEAGASSECRGSRGPGVPPLAGS